MNAETREIVDVFHAHAYTTELDFFARRHIHGLDRSFLKKSGYENADKLIDAFHEWLSGKHYIMMFANDPGREIRDLRLYITDIGLDNWQVRSQRGYHEIAYYYKKHNIPICQKRCSKEAHSSYHSTYVRKFNASDAARKRHGYHCALYDCYELYLFYISNVTQTSACIV